MYREHAYWCQVVKGQDKIFEQNWLESSVKGVTLLKWDANSLRVTSLLSQSFINNFVLPVFTPDWRGFVGGELVAKDRGTGNPARPTTVILRVLLTLPFGCRLSSLVFVVLIAIFFGLFSVHITNPWESNYDVVVLIKYFVTQVCASKKNL